MAALVDAPDSKSGGARVPCRFEPDLRYCEFAGETQHRHPQVLYRSIPIDTLSDPLSKEEPDGRTRTCRPPKPPEHYARIAPDALDSLMLEERHRLYKMLRLDVFVRPDSSLEVRGVFGESVSLSDSELVPLYKDSRKLRLLETVW